MAINPEKPQNEPQIDQVDASINARLTSHLMENAVKPDNAVAPRDAAMGIRERVIVAGGTAFLMSILGLFSLLDLRKRFL